MSSLYRPTVFRMDQRATLLAHAAAYPFATVITYGEGGLAVSHLPLLIDPEREVLRGHVARGNRQLAHLTAGAEALAIFHGPHGHVPPPVYEGQPSVPTWNCGSVHARDQYKPREPAWNAFQSCSTACGARPAARTAWESRSVSPTMVPSPLRIQTS